MRGVLLAETAVFVELDAIRPEHAAIDGHTGLFELCAADGQPGAAAGLFSILLRPQYTQAQVDRFCDALQLFKLGYSWGGPISLVVPYELETMRQQWPQGLERGTLVRFSVGLESVDDLWADLQQALAQMQGPD